MDKEIKRFIESEMVDFGIQFQSERRSFLKNKISASGQLAQSIQYEIDKQSREDTVSMLIAFEEHGRFIDMKRLKAVIPSKSDNEYVREIENWIITRGWQQKFIYEFRRKHSLRKMTPNILHHIAWGIVMSRAKRVRPRKWYNKYKTRRTPDLFNKVAAGLPAISSDLITQNFKKT